MSSKKYQEAYDNMTDKQKDVMWELWMSAINRDGHAWVTFGQVEDAVAEILGFGDEAD